MTTLKRKGLEHVGDVGESNKQFEWFRHKWKHIVSIDMELKITFGPGPSLLPPPRLVWTEILRVTQWCRDNCQGRFDAIQIGATLCFGFELETDAMAFKLTFVE